MRWQPNDGQSEGADYRPYGGDCATVLGDVAPNNSAGKLFCRTYTLVREMATRLPQPPVHFDGKVCQVFLGCLT